jgi:hypothetical protein
MPSPGCMLALTPTGAKSVNRLSLRVSFADLPSNAFGVSLRAFERLAAPRVRRRITLPTSLSQVVPV